MRFPTIHVRPINVSETPKLILNYYIKFDKLQINLNLRSLSTWTLSTIWWLLAESIVMQESQLFNPFSSVINFSVFIHIGCRSEINLVIPRSKIHLNYYYYYHYFIIITLCREAHWDFLSHWLGLKHLLFTYVYFCSVHLSFIWNLKSKTKYP